MCACRRKSPPPPSHACKLLPPLLLLLLQILPRRFRGGEGRLLRAQDAPHLYVVRCPMNRFDGLGGTNWTLFARRRPDRLIDLTCGRCRCRRRRRRRGRGRGRHTTPRIGFRVVRAIVVGPCTRGVSFGRCGYPIPLGTRSLHRVLLRYEHVRPANLFPASAPCFRRLLLTVPLTVPLLLLSLLLSLLFSLLFSLLLSRAKPVRGATSNRADVGDQDRSPRDSAGVLQEALPPGAYGRGGCGGLRRRGQGSGEI